MSVCVCVREAFARVLGRRMGKGRDLRKGKGKRSDTGRQAKGEKKKTCHRPSA